MLVYFAVILTVLLGFCGLALDTGRMEARTLQLQAAADAGALAGASELARTGSGSSFQTAAQSDVTQTEALNGLPTSGSVSTVQSATYGSYIADYSSVQTTVTQSVPTLFLGLLSHANSSLTLSAKATAQMPPCVVLLGNPNVNNGFNQGYNSFGWQVASANVDTNAGCPIYTKYGLFIDGFAHIAGSQISTSGPASGTVISGWDSYTPIYNAPVVADPLAYLAAPTRGSCVNSSPIVITNASSSTIYPGTYCGQTSGGNTTPAISVSGPTSNGQCSGSPVMTVSPGLYIFVGGINASCLTISGTGVTMYFTNSSTVGFGQMTLRSVTWNVSAPNDASGGGIPGVVLFGDRSWTGGNEDFQFFWSNWVGDGVIYTTGTGIYDYGTSMSAPNYLNIVSANVYTYNCQVRPSVNYANLPAGNPLHTVISLVQ